MDLAKLMRDAVASHVEQINFDGGDCKPWILFIFPDEPMRDGFIEAAGPEYPTLRALDDLWAEINLPND